MMSVHFRLLGKIDASIHLSINSAKYGANCSVAYFKSFAGRLSKSVALLMSSLCQVYVMYSWILLTDTGLKLKGSLAGFLQLS